MQTGEWSGIDLEAIERARDRIAPLIVRTPLRASRALSDRSGAAVSLKLESMQPTGAFKLRGAANAILDLDPDERERGIVTCSAGNHGRAVAYVARHLHIPATIFMSPLVPANKVSAIEELGARVVVSGKDFDEAAEAAAAFCERGGMTFVHAFDHPAVIAGQGTIALEILEDRPEVDVLIVPLSGGGLLAGIAVVVKTLKPEARIIGVSMERGPAMYASLQSGRPVEVVEEPSLADALTGGIGLDNRWTFPLVRDLVDEVLLVSEEEIASAMVHALVRERLVLEGAGATPLAVLLRDNAGLEGANVVAVCTGDNVDMRSLLALVAERDGM